jgi:hypothetical protein
MMQVATTFIIMAFSITTLSIMGLLATLGTIFIFVTLIITGVFATLSINDIRRK